MSLRCRDVLALFLLGALALGVPAASGADRVLRVCADPDNLPYSHRDGTGFENRIAQLVARELDAKLDYTWMPQWRGFVRKTLNAGLCDVLIGVPSDFELVRTTEPYYRSSYVFVYRRDSGSGFERFDDPRLALARIGVQLIGNDLAATPPGHALAQRGLTDNVVGYTIFGERPQVERMIDALARGDLDVALAWGPPAAYYARRQAVPLGLSIATAPRDLAGLPFEFSMSMGVRKSDKALHDALDAVVSKRRADIGAILAEYGVPQVDTSTRQVSRVER